MIVDFIFRALQIPAPTYLDIGANDPRMFNNTYFFYLKGSKGVSIEPDPSLFRVLARERPYETLLNVGVAAAPSPSLPFYVMSTPTLNTFSESEAHRYAATGMHKIERVDTIEVLTVDQIVTDHFGGTAPDLLSVDVEGLDFEIINSIDFDRIRPTVICVETLTFSESRDEIKLEDIRDLILGNGYKLYADTYINSIFVDERKWLNRQ